MPYRDFKGTDADVSGWSDGQINRAIRSGRLIYIQEEPQQTAEPEPAPKKTTRKSTAKKTTKK